MRFYMEQLRGHAQFCQQDLERQPLCDDESGHRRGVRPAARRRVGPWRTNGSSAACNELVRDATGESWTATSWAWRQPMLYVFLHLGYLLRLVHRTDQAPSDRTKRTRPPGEGAQRVLQLCALGQQVLAMLHPFMPFLTEEHLAGAAPQRRLPSCAALGPPGSRSCALRRKNSKWKT